MTQGQQTPLAKGVRAYRLFRLFVAWAVSCVILTVTHLATVYDGLPSLISAPLEAIIVSTSAILVVSVLGLTLRMKLVARWWYASWLPAAGMLALGVVLYLHGLIFADYSTNDAGTPMVNLRTSFPVGYFLALFALAHGPIAALLGPSLARQT